MEIINYLDENMIDYKLGGNNIGRNWIGIKECLFCGDNGFHFAINKNNGGISCWACEEKGHFNKFIAKFENISWSKAKEKSKLYIDEFSFEEEKEHISFKGNILPPEASINFPQIHLNYLKNRNFNPQSLIKKYRLKSTYNVGRYRFKIIAPVFMDRKIVNFVACDITGKAGSKYLFPQNEKVAIPIHDCLYNYDSIVGVVIIVEGVTDVWRMGSGAVASFGKNLSQAQIKLIVEKEISKAIIIPDFDAQKKGEKIAEQLSGIINSVDIVYLDSGDVGDLSPIEAIKLKRELGL